MAGCRLSNQQMLVTFLLATIGALVAFSISLQVTRTLGIDKVRPEKIDWYIGYSYNLLDGNGYADCIPNRETLRCADNSPLLNRAYRLPGYPVYLLGNLLLFGDDFPLAPILLLQSILVAMIVFLTMCFAARYGQTAAVIAGLCLFVSGALYFFASIMATEILFTFLLLLFFITLVRSQHNRDFVFSGVCLGLAMFTRGVLLFTIPLLIFGLPRRRYLDFALLLAAPILFTSIWTARNYTVFGEVVPFSTGSGRVIWGVEQCRSIQYSARRMV